MHFFHSFWKKLHLTENFYTDMSVVSVTNKRYAAPLTAKTYSLGLFTFRNTFFGQSAKNMLHILQVRKGAMINPKSPKTYYIVCP